MPIGISFYTFQAMSYVIDVYRGDVRPQRKIFKAIKLSVTRDKGSKGDVTIEAKSDGKEMTFIITDTGKPFDPTAKPEVDITLSAEDRAIGGLGIHLIRQITDRINYERTDGHNILTLIKKLSIPQE